MENQEQVQVAEKVRKVLAPCPPAKKCAICEARLNEVFGSADPTAKYIHQAVDAVQAIKLAVAGSVSVDVIIALGRRAATYGRLALEGQS